MNRSEDRRNTGGTSPPKIVPDRLVRIGEGTGGQTDPALATDQGPLLIVGGDSSRPCEAAKSIFTRAIADADSPVIALDGYGTGPATSHRRGYGEIAVSGGGQRCYRYKDGFVLDPAQSERNATTDSPVLCAEIGGLTADDLEQMDLHGLINALAGDIMDGIGPVHLVVDPLNAVLVDDRLAAALVGLWRTARSRGSTVVAKVPNPELLRTCRTVRLMRYLSSVCYTSAALRTLTAKTSGPKSRQLNRQLKSYDLGAATDALSRNPAAHAVLDPRYEKITPLAIDQAARAWTLERPANDRRDHPWTR